MKIRDIHIKLFIAVLFILIVLQVYFFIDLNYSSKKGLSPERDHNRVVRILMLKSLIEEKIRYSGGIEPAREELQKLFSEISVLYEGKIWIEDAEGTPVLLSFSPGEIPEKPDIDTFRLTERDGISISQFYHNDLKLFFTETALNTKSGDGHRLQIYYESKRNNYLSEFTIGLTGIILIMAILTLSLLQFIRIKVNRFKGSVLQIADGDLSHRVSVNGRGVVEDLGLAFNRMADKLEKMIASSKEITANVSHEIRTPLARIRVLEEFLRKKIRRGDYSEFERHLDSIRDDIQILDDLVGRLLEFVKLDLYETIQKDGTFEPSGLMNDLLIRFEPIIELKKLRIDKDTPPLPPISGNRNAITSAFLNVLDNAVKYTPDHGTVTIRMFSSNEKLETNIINSFKEMPEKDLKNIFNPFARLRHSENAGSGLGLAISKKIIEKHGGEIAALNVPEGFSIRIRLPLKKA